jgi:hypothetical protein
MKWVALLLAGVVTTSSGQPEPTWACQYTESSGFRYDEGKWKPARFQTREPFFIRMKAGNLDKESLKSLLGKAASQEVV